MAEFVKWLLVDWWALGSLLVVTSVGKPRKPLTAGMAAFVVALGALQVVAVVLFWKN